MRGKTAARDGVTLRAVLLGILFIPANVYLVVQWETVWGTQYPTTMSIFFNAVFSLFLVVCLNGIWRRLSPRTALRQGELLTFYLVLVMAVAVSGHDFSQTIFCTLGTARWYATPENEWGTLFGPYVPQWLTMNDPVVLRGLYEGDTTIYRAEYARAWVRPIFWWTLFLTAIVWTALCLNVLVRRQWIEHEKLSYPLTHLPFEMTEPTEAGFWRRPALWLGIGLGGGVTLWNGIAYLWPVVPTIPLVFDVGPQITAKPWSAVGDLRIQLNPYAIGLAFAIPLDLLFSSWFFFFLWEGQRVLGSALGVRVPGYPFPDQQLLGGYLTIGLILLWTGRRFFLRMFWKGVRFRRESVDAEEPMSHRAALWGAFGGIVFLTVFLWRAGAALWFGLGFFVVYYGILFTFTRMRAEVGPPLQGIHYSGPLQLFVALLGSRRIPVRTLTVAAPLWTHTKELRNHPMPFLLEGFKLAQRADMDTRRLWKVMLLSAALGVPVTFWAWLQASYQWGGVGGWRGVAAYNTVERWVLQRSDPDPIFLSATGFGAAVVLVNTVLRLRFVGWPLHPLGYLLAGYYHFERLWFPFLVAWAIKRLTLQFGGIRGFRRVFPFFLGLVLGEFIVGSCWGMYGLLTATRTYAFKGW
ncbi:MAG: hypothetical protein KatS3mg115_1594 [Candidatus Poribacteria bacterium]|nr:MAG: hypothetical protein KatS3mg115_1594 [Candidatus Poribacteria bacterium]